MLWLGAGALLMTGCASRPPVTVFTPETPVIRQQTVTDSPSIKVVLFSVEVHVSGDSNNPTATLVPDESETEIEIEVVGQVLKPGKYKMPMAASLADLWRAAGGATLIWNRRIAVSVYVGQNVQTHWAVVKWSRYPKSQDEWDQVVMALDKIPLGAGAVIYFAENVH